MMLEARSSAEYDAQEVPLKPIESRTVKVAIDIVEKREGSYSLDTVAEAALVIPLPASEAVIIQVFTRALETALAGVDLIRGSLLVVDPVAVPQVAPGEILETPSDIPF
jgi:hypothetical protein